MKAALLLAALWLAAPATTGATAWHRCKSSPATATSPSSIAATQSACP
ncbi:hypothetical protein [Prosthecobacter sp.]|nr:hypothetical protein [Prosthecobacter sp.]MDI1310727.1 hypothetical protein [Prosthecobacter sp.]